jgi:hypothetical protein
VVITWPAINCGGVGGVSDALRDRSLRHHIRDVTSPTTLNLNLSLIIIKLAK